MNMNNFFTRAVTGILFVAVMVGCIVSHPIAFGFLFAIITALSIYEFGHLINQNTDARINQLLTALAGSYLFLAFMAYSIDVANVGIFAPYLMLIAYLMISELYLKKSNPLGNWAYTMLSQVYIALPFSLLNTISFHQVSEWGNVTYNPILPLSIFVFLWMSDTGAYCFGSLFGKHRLFERISPKKSWEGSMGGAAVAILVSLVFAYFFPVLSTINWIGLALVVVVFGTWGDLIESLFKRQLGVKDSGSILPGHGGMLDRFDSSLLAIPAAVVYLFLLAFNLPIIH